MTAYGALDLSAGEPTRVTDLMLEALGFNASIAAFRIDAPTRAVRGALTHSRGKG